jgi:hypothetical protein
LPFSSAPAILVLDDNALFLFEEVAEGLLRIGYDTCCDRFGGLIVRYCWLDVRHFNVAVAAEFCRCN